MSTEPVRSVRVRLLGSDMRDSAAVWIALALPGWLLAVHVGYWLAAAR